jgi:hypothetical protein
MLTGTAMETAPWAKLGQLRKVMRGTGGARDYHEGTKSTKKFL